MRISSRILYVLEHWNPRIYHPHLYFPGIIVVTASLLALGLGKIRQPKVIAEVLGGIILGASCLLLFSCRNAKLDNTQVQPRLVCVIQTFNHIC
jgi:Kef-type K+ transport systems, membrane components